MKVSKQSLVAQYISGAGTENDLWVSRLGEWMDMRLQSRTRKTGQDVGLGKRRIVSSILEP